MIKVMTKQNTCNIRLYRNRKQNYKRNIMDYQNEDYDLQQGGRMIDTILISGLIPKNSPLIIRHTLVRIIICYIFTMLMCSKHKLTFFNNCICII